MSLAMLFGTAQAAMATAPSKDYCNKTLLGAATLAPDNDIAAEKRRIESFGIDVKFIVAMNATQVIYPEKRLNWWVVGRADGKVRQEVFSCWRDLDLWGQPTGTYHDALYNIPTGWYYP